MINTKMEDYISLFNELHQKKFKKPPIIKYVKNGDCHIVSISLNGRIYRYIDNISKKNARRNLCKILIEKEVLKVCMEKSKNLCFKCNNLLSKLMIFHNEYIGIIRKIIGDNDCKIDNSSIMSAFLHKSILVEPNIKVINSFTKKYGYKKLYDYKKYEYFGDIYLKLFTLKNMLRDDKKYISIGKNVFKLGDINKEYKKVISNFYYKYISRSIGLHKYIIHNINDCIFNTKIVSDIFESLIGLMYENLPIKKVDRFIQKCFKYASQCIKYKVHNNW